MTGQPQTVPSTAPSSINPYRLAYHWQCAQLPDGAGVAPDIRYRTTVGIRHGVELELVAKINSNGRFSHLRPLPSSEDSIKKYGGPELACCGLPESIPLPAFILCLSIEHQNLHCISLRNMPDIWITKA